MTVVKINAGFVGPGQTAKSFVGKVATSEGGTTSQALETVTPRTTSSSTFEGVVTEGSKIIKQVSSFAGLLEPGSELEGTGIKTGSILLQPTPQQVAKNEIEMSVAAESTQVKKVITVKKVTASGKTFYITDIYISTSEEATAKGARVLDCRIQAAGVDIFRAAVHNLSPVEMPGIETQPFATQGQAVVLLLPKTTGFTTEVWFNIFGFEQ